MSDILENKNPSSTPENRHTPIAFGEKTKVLAIFFVTVNMLYFSTWQAGFVTDFTGLQERLDGAPFSDFLHCFGFPALHQVTNFFLFLFYKMFGVNALPWYLVYTSLHVANGWLGYLLAKKILGQNPLAHKGEYNLGNTGGLGQKGRSTGPVYSNEPQNLMRGAAPTPPTDLGYAPFGTGAIGLFFSNISTPAFIAALLFLVSPYNAEAVIWKVCFNFLFCTCMMLTSLLFLVKYLEKKKIKGLIYSILFFVVALFTFELALALPLIILAFFFFWKNNFPLIKTPPAFLSVIPFFILSAIYFLLNKIILGGWVGHYGEGVHLNFDIKNIAANLLKYFSKNLLYWREWGHEPKQVLIAFFENPATAYTALLVGVSVLLLGIVFYKKINQKIKTVGFAWLLFFLALLPVANLYVVWLLHGENDRYGYFASLFFYMGLVAFSQLFNKKIKWLLCGVFLFVSIFNLIKINDYWKNSAAIVHSLLDGFKWGKNSEIYVLAFPENYKGIPMFKDFSRQNLALKSALKYLANKPSEGEFYQVAQFNMNTPDDGLFENSDSSEVIKLEFREWGSWWWRHGLGTGPYETDQYDFNTAPKGCEVTVKKVADDAVFIYSDGGEWREVRFLWEND